MRVAIPGATFDIIRHKLPGHEGADGESAPIREEAMALRVSGKNLDVGDALRSQIETRVTAALAKYFDGSYTGHVTLARDGGGFRTECVFHLSTGITIEASGSAFDAYASLDRGMEHVEARLRRYKQRLKDHAAPGADPAPASDRGGAPAR